MKKKEKLISDLKMTFNGTPWYGSSLMEKLNAIDFKFVNEKPSSSQNSIAAIVQHLINWRVFTIEKLKGNTTFNIELNTKEDWGTAIINDVMEWEKLLVKLHATQDKIINLLKEDIYLQGKVPGKDYDYYFLIRGTIQHDIYHSGQIGLLYAQLKNNFKNRPC